MQKIRKQGLVADLWPNIRLMQLSGLFISEYYDDNSALMRLIRKMYSWTVFGLVFMNYLFMGLWAATQSYNADQRATHAVTILFFTHSLIKFIFFSSKTENFYRVLASWNNANSHPLFAESNARHRATSLGRMRKLLTTVGSITIFATVSWTVVTFIGDSTHEVPDPETVNETMIIEVPRLMVPATYPFDVSHGMAHIGVLVYQVKTNILINYCRLSAQFGSPSRFQVLKKQFKTNFGNQANKNSPSFRFHSIISITFLQFT